MPTTTTAPPPRPVPDSAALWATAAALAALAAVEVLLGHYLGPFWSTYRAEALPLVPFRPWLLVGGALLASGWPLGWRAAFYAAGILAAGVNESLYLTRLGNPDPWPEMLRIAAASAVLVALADAATRLARRRFGGAGAVAAAAAIALLLLIPAVLKPYQRAIAGSPGAGAALQRTEVVLMTALPIIWGEGGAFDPNSRPAGIYRALQEEFTIRPIDVLDRENLGRSRLLFLAQPRWLAPEELVDLDRWLRSGGRALILADPELDWPSELPLGDIRRPPPASLLDPLLGHWGLKLEAGRRREGGIFVRGRLLEMHQSGRLSASGGSCRSVRRYLADCRLGSGRALVLADADLMRDDLWIGAGEDGAERHRRLSDNPLVVADLLDELAGIERDRVAAPVAWRSPRQLPVEALARAVVPLALLAILLAAGALRARRRQGITCLSTAR